MVLPASRAASISTPRRCPGAIWLSLLGGYSYPFSLARRGVVATIDLSARNLHMLRTDHWLADPGNTVQVWLKGRAWDANEQTVNNIMVEGPPRAPLQEWSTSELAARCIGEDAEGQPRDL